MKRLSCLLFVLLALAYTANSQIERMREQLDDVEAEQEGILTLRFYNALDGEPIVDADILIQDMGEFKTDMEGKVRFPNPGKDGRFPFQFSKEGFITTNDVFEIIGGTIFYYRFTQSPMIDLGTYRFILEWDKKPDDLDAHLEKPGDYHISYRRMLSANDGKVRLDRDDRDGFGPETITVENLDDQNEYIFWVFDYTNQDKSGSKNLSKSKARVRIFGDGQLLNTYQITPKEEGNTWMVFRIVKGQIVPVDEISFNNN
ncbi:MAG: hypothetical protein KKA81_13390 [Bacteroidetes bacterium]|nr:hypothetical protein [Bacteroidota bacterium]